MVSRHRSRPARANRFAQRPRLEPLERRDLLASYTTLEDTPLIVSDPALAGLVVVKPPEHGTVSRTNVGGFAYVPAKDYNGPDRFTYALLTTASGTVLPAETQEVTIAVTPVNDPPVAEPNEYATLRDTALTVPAPGVLKNDRDVDSTELTALLVTPPTRGTLELAANGSFKYIPSPGFVGADWFTYRVSDGTTSSNTAATSNTPGFSNEAKVYINVRGLPDARDDQYVVAQNGVLNILPRGVLANDLGINGRPLVASLEPGDTSLPQHGTLELRPDGSFTYKPNAGYSGPDSFVYRATDTAPSTNTEPGSSTPAPPPAPFDVARVHLFVRATPTVRATPDVYETVANKRLAIASPGVLKNDFVLWAEPITDPATGANTTQPGLLPPNYPLYAKLLTPPESGELVLRENGAFEYQPKPDFAGTVTFTYQAILPATISGTPQPPLADPTGERSDIATVTILIKQPEPPPAPIARNDFFTAIANTPLTIREPGVLANDSPGGILPQPATNGERPILPPLTAVLVTNPASGTLVLRANGSFEYVPNPGFVGTDTFQYQAVLPASTDPTTPATADVAPPPGSIATVTIKVLPALARNDEYAMLQNALLDIRAPGVLANDAGGSNTNPLQATLVAAPLHGRLELSATGAFIYQPNPGFTGTDLFVYRAGPPTNPPTDPATAASHLAAGNSEPGTPGTAQPSDVAIVRIYVRAAQPTVQAYPDKYATPQNTDLVVPAPGVLGNDYALVNHRVAASLHEGPAHGTVAVNADGSFTYKPAENFVGEDKFVYKATDLDAAPTSANTSAAGTTNVSFATVFIRVHSTLAPPKFIPGDNLLRTTDESGPERLAEWATIVDLAGAAPPAYSVTTDKPQLFAAPPQIDATGQLTYTPAPNAKGTAVVTVALAGDVSTFSIQIDKPHPQFNALKAHDVTGDTKVLSGDALAVINHINAFGITSATAAEGEAPTNLYLDVSKDNLITALDALLVINFLNAGLEASPDAAEGESAAAAADWSLLGLLQDDAAQAKRKRS